jgi:hypothetical protein
MPLITPQDKRKPERITITLDPDVAIDLGIYGDYCEGSDRNHVVNAALKLLFTQDKGFKPFKESVQNNNGKAHQV